MDFQLTEQQRRMVAAVRELAQGEFKADAQKYMDGTFPWANMKKLAEIGVLGMSVPEEYGGAGLPIPRNPGDWINDQLQHAAPRWIERPTSVLPVNA